MNNPVRNQNQGATVTAAGLVKQLAQEPLEIAKTAAGQVGLESRPFQSPPAGTGSLDQGNPTGFGEEEKKKQAQVDLSRLRELENEVKKIQIDNQVKEIQQKMMAGETIYLEEYPQIPIEEKQVLKAQMEALKQRSDAAAASTFREEPSSRPSRRGLFGPKKSKQAVDQLQRQTETRLPPSG